MQEVIFCLAEVLAPEGREQRGMATKWGKQGWAVFRPTRKIGFLEASGSYGRRLLGLRSTDCAPSLNLPALGRCHTLSRINYPIFTFLQ